MKTSRMSWNNGRYKAKMKYLDMNVLIPYLIVICVSIGNHIMNMFKKGKMSMAVTSTEYPE